MDFASSLERLNKLFPRVIDLGLGRTLRLLKQLGRPDRYLPPVVHVAGTNGKGSVISFLFCMLEAAGYKVHVYTSPHLVRFNERIRLSGKIITDKELSSVLDLCLRINQRKEITLFEITTVAAFVAFARNPADILLIETGLGGRFDATNLIPKPYLTVLTHVSIDHEDYLGKGLINIANEKAGIFKEGCPAVVGAQSRIVSKVIARRARLVGTALWRENFEWQLNHRKFGIIFESLKSRRLLPAPNLLGKHQRNNAGLSVACLDQMRSYHISDSAVRAGLTNVRWPARFQCLSKGPLTKLLSPNTKVWVDGGHNAGAGAALAKTIKDEFGKGSFCLVVGMLNNKSLEDFLRPFIPDIKCLWGISIVGESNTIPANDISERAGKMGFTANPAMDLVSAIAAGSRTNSNILICGSLYLAGQVLAANNEEPL